MHLVLEKLTDRNSLDRVLNQLLGEGLLDEGDTDPIKQKINEFLQDPIFASWFTPEWKVFGERTIISEGREYRPDRVISKDGATIVIDYKREKVETSHKRQINRYASLLDRMGYTSIQKYLV